jgi:hypothetical protein
MCLPSVLGEKELTVMIKDTKEKLIGHNRKKKILEKYQYGNVWRKRQKKKTISKDKICTYVSLVPL